jgi:hypothetical protein
LFTESASKHSALLVDLHTSVEKAVVESLLCSDETTSWAGSRVDIPRASRAWSQVG